LDNTILVLVICAFVGGWMLVPYIYRRYRFYNIPFIIFQLGVTLLFVSIFFIGGWEGMGYGFLAFIIMGIGLMYILILLLLQFFKQI